MENRNNILISAVVITRNEERDVEKCLKSVSFADEIIVIDSQSTDRTVEIARKNGARVVTKRFQNFSDQRNEALSQASGVWLLYIDADEQITEELKKELKEIISDQTECVAYRIPRKNYYFREYVWPYIEKPERLFKKSSLKKWYGDVHESPTVEGEIGELKQYLLHYTHDDLESMTKKTNEWSEIEATLLFKSGHPAMKEWRFVRIMISKFYDSYVRQGGWRIGVPGLIESIYQSYSYFITYAKLWERQQTISKDQVNK